MGHSMRSSETSMAYFPQQLIDEILTMLPVKSLIRFKCISKYWNDLISNNPHFAKLHHKRTTQHPNPLTRTTLAVICQSGLDLQSIGCTTLFDKNMLQEIQEIPGSRFHLYSRQEVQDLQSRLDLQVFDFAKERLNERVSLGYLACSNGLVCVFTPPRRYFEDIYIWNPATRLHRKLPSPTLPKSRDSEIYAAGFGYIDSKDDYMVLALIKPGNIHKIYSLSADKWTTVTPKPKYNGQKFERPSFMGTYLNGAIHWLVSTPEGLNYVIMAFDLVTETYYQMFLLDYPVFYPHLLFAFEECLGVIFMDGHYYFSTWIMKEYNRKESWTQFSLDVPNLESQMAVPLLRSSTDDNQVLVVSAPWNVWYDLNVYNLEERTSITIFPYSDWISAGVNVESLASIHPKQTNHK